MVNGVGSAFGSNPNFKITDDPTTGSVVNVNTAISTANTITVLFQMRRDTANSLGWVKYKVDGVEKLALTSNSVWGTNGFDTTDISGWALGIAYTEGCSGTNTVYLDDIIAANYNAVGY